MPAVLAVVDWYAVARRRSRLEAWAKPATLLSLAGAAASVGATERAGGWWLLTALLLGALGDAFLLVDTPGRFRAGLAAFLIGHLAYLGCFVAVGLQPRGWSWLGLGVLAVTLVVTRSVIAATYRLEGLALAVPVTAYMVVIGAMLVTAWLTGVPLIAAGATLFVVSDAMLGLNRFVRPWRWADLMVIVSYHLGQALIVAGMLG